MTLTDLSRTTWTTFFILKRNRNSKTSSFSFSKRDPFTLQTAIIRLILKKVILSWNQKWFHQIESQFFWNHFGFTRYFQLLGGIFFFPDLVSTSKNSCFLAKIHHKQGFKKSVIFQNTNRKSSFWKTYFVFQNRDFLLNFWKMILFLKPPTNMKSQYITVILMQKIDDFLWKIRVFGSKLRHDCSNFFWKICFSRKVIKKLQKSC